MLSVWRVCQREWTSWHGRKQCTVAQKNRRTERARVGGRGERREGGSSQKPLPQLGSQLSVRRLTERQFPLQV